MFLFVNEAVQWNAHPQKIDRVRHSAQRQIRLLGNSTH
jgi:hypothetical protein